MADDEQFSLCWNNFNSNLLAGFHESLIRGDLVDVTLEAEGQFVKAHRLVLSVYSPNFRKMFTQMPHNQYAFVFLKGVSHSALKDLIQFMYCGKVNVKQEALPAFISTAEALQIKVLTDSDPPASQSPAIICDLLAGFHESLIRGDLVDVTLAAEGQFVKAHRLVLSVCSPYFRKMFTQMPHNQDAFVFLKDVSHSALKDLIQFMYCGKVNVKQEALPAFISTAEALQIKALTDSDPPATQSPAEPSTPSTHIQTINTSPRIRQRTTTRTYKLETVDDGIDEQQQNQKLPQTTQILIQTVQSGSLGTQQQHLQQVVQQTVGTLHQIAAVAAPSSTSTSTPNVSNNTHRRPMRGSLASDGAPHVKRTKNSSATTTAMVDPLDTANDVVTPQGQQITVQTALVTNAAATVKNQQSSETTTEYIDLPIELPTKSEPDYTEEGADVESGENDGTYVEDDSYGDMRYVESYFEENEDGGNVSTAANNTDNAATAPTTSKAIIKKSSSYSESFAANETNEQTNTDAQAMLVIVKNCGEQLFILSRRGGRLHLVINDFIYRLNLQRFGDNKNTVYWECIHNRSGKCRSRLKTINNDLYVTNDVHNHAADTARIQAARNGNVLFYRMFSNVGT